MDLGKHIWRRTRAARGVAGAFLRDEDGSVIMFGLYAGVLSLMLGGIAVDVMHYEAVRTAIQNTADVASLAATNLNNTQNPTAVVDDYFKKAGMSSYLKSVTVTSSANYRQVQVTASTSVPTFFMKLEGINALTSNNDSTAVQSIGNVEIALALDNSGSMAQIASYTPTTVCSTSSSSGWGWGWNSYHDDDHEGHNQSKQQSCYTQYVPVSKIQALKDAANKFVDTVYAQANSNGVTMSIVPYDAHVNIGPELMSDLTLVPTKATQLTGCIDENALDFSSTSISATTPLIRYPYFQAYGSGSQCNSSPSRESVVYSNNPTTLHNAINAMQAGGMTSIDLATKWAAATLDPSFQPVVTKMIQKGELTSDYSGRPAAFGNSNHMKVLIVMSDGENTSREDMATPYESGPSPVWYDSSTGRYSYYDATRKQYYSVSGRSWNSTPDGSNPTQLSYPELWQQMSVSTYASSVVQPAEGTNPYYQIIQSTGSTTMDNNLQDICNAAKNEGILVYTIGFQTSTHGRQVLSNCATDTSFYFDAQGTDISSVFSKIAASIQHLRLTQ